MKQVKKEISKILYSCCEPFKRLGFNMFSSTTAGNYIPWGHDDLLPNKIYELYMSDILLHSICEGLKDFIMGDGIELSEELKRYITDNTVFNSEGKYTVNSYGDDLEDIVSQSVKDLIILGTYANDIYFNPAGDISEIYYMDVIKDRISSSKDSVIYKDKGWIHGTVTAEIPLLGKSKEGKKAREVFFHWNEKERTVYPYPYYYAALDSVEIDKDITLFHKNGLKNGFSQFRILYYPGTLKKEEKDHIYEMFEQTMTGPVNAGGTMITFDNGTGVRPEIIAAPEDNQHEKYKTLEESIRRRIFGAFRAHPVLFGIPVEGTGFSEQEFLEVFKLSLNTLIRPFRNKIIRDYSYIFGMENPFSFKKTELEISLEGITETSEIE